MLPVLPTDPLFPFSWHLLNTGQNGGLAGIDIRILPVWEHYRGAGITIAVVDDGVADTVPDLEGALLTIEDRLLPGTPSSRSDSHGTQVAGLIAARADNGILSVGVAPESSLVGYRAAIGTVFGGVPVTAIFADALDRDIGLLNNSWGARTISTPFVPDADEAAAIARLATEGRAGLGSIVVFANGNARKVETLGAPTTSDLDARVADKNVIAVAAVMRDGEVAPYSSPGANLLIAAPAGDAQAPETYDPALANGVISTDLPGPAGSNRGEGAAGDMGNFDGTSAASPIVTGVIALMLEANPDLGLRDVKEILAITARRIDPTDADWVTTVTPGINGGAMAFSRDFGFGLVDAAAAVRLAETWGTPRQTLGWDELAGSVGGEALVAGSLTRGFTIGAGQPFVVEQLELTLALTLPAGQATQTILRVDLTSPSGTTIRVADTAVTAWLAQGVTFGTPGFWGETGAGDWTLTITIDAAAGIRFDSASLRLFGDDGKGPAPRADLVYTDSFADAAAADPSRARITQGSVLNAAAVSTAVILDIARGEGTIAGVAVDILAPLTRVYAGGGADNITGSNGRDRLAGGWGGDTLRGITGADTLEGDAGDDLLQGGDSDDLLIGGAGADLLLGVAGIDILIGGAGDDTLRGGSEGDALLGGDGRDRLMGNDGADSLVGGADSDTLFGHAGSDTLDGGTGNDLLVGGSGNVKLVGGAGDDTLRSDTGRDDLNGGEGNDLLDGGGDDDGIVGDAGDDTLRGGDGVDVLFGGIGSDSLHGGDGDDQIFAGTGADTLRGGAGADIFFFEPEAGDDLSLVDVIVDFDAFDLIDVSFAYGNLVSGATLRLIGSTPFSGSAGEVRLAAERNATLLSFDVDGDAAGDLGIRLLRVTDLSETQILGLG